MRAVRPGPALALLTCLAAGVSAPATAHAAEPEAAAEAEVQILVFRQNGAGSATTAQKYVDQVLDVIGGLTGWSVGGKYVTSQAKADAFIKESQPRFGLISLSAFLPMAKTHKLKGVGRADVKGGGGGQYFVVSKNHFDLAGCKGKSLASDHAGDATFVDKVVAGGAFTLDEFKVQTTRRPLQTLKAVIRGEAECALVDDAQIADLAHVDGGHDLRAVWASESFPGLVVVDFPAASKGEAKAFHDSLSKVCKGDGRKACAAAGIESLESAAAKDFAGYLKAYNG